MNLEQIALSLSIAANIAIIVSFAGGLYWWSRVRQDQKRRQAVVDRFFHQRTAEIMTEGAKRTDALTELQRIDKHVREILLVLTATSELLEDKTSVVPQWFKAT